MANDREIVESMLRGLVSHVEYLPGPTLRRLAPLLGQAQGELEKDLRSWLAGLDGSERFTTQRYRQLLLQIRRSLETIRRITPEMVEGLRIGSNTAGILATQHLEQEVIRMSSLFTGSINMVSLDTAAILADSENLLLHRIKRSAARYTGDIPKEISRELAVGRLRGETLDELARRLERNIPHIFSKARRKAALVARTETMHAYNAHHKAGLEELLEEDDGYRMMWDSTLDYRRCPQCASLDNAVIQIGDKRFKAEWNSGRPKARRKHKTTHRHPPAHPNCRCILVPWHVDWKKLPPRKENPPAPQRRAA